MIEPFKKPTIAKFKKASGMLRKVLKMVEENKYCVDIMQQSLATQGIIRAACLLILESHLNTCVTSGKKSPAARKKMVKELVKIIEMSKK